MFNINEYINDLEIPKDDEDLLNANKLVNLVELITDDGYLARAYHWGVTSAMENQLNYLGDRLIPSMEQKRASLGNPRGVMHEDDLRVSWASNESQPHINDEVLAEDHIAELDERIEQVRVKLRTAAILYVIFRNAHDQQSALLNQLSYSGIKAQAEANRRARERRSA